MGTFIAQMMNNHILNADEVREEFLDKNPQVGGIGKKYWAPSNTMPISDDGTIPVKQSSVNATRTRPVPKPNGLASHH